MDFKIERARHLGSVDNLNRRHLKDFAENQEGKCRPRHSNRS